MNVIHMHFRCICTLEIICRDIIMIFYLYVCWIKSGSQGQVQGVRDKGKKIYEPLQGLSI
jgi:hypothetical protein